MIYIDPPYNTGKDFVYKDNYKDNLAEYNEKFNRTDVDGNVLSSETNNEGNARYHSNWLNMMYPRLQLARTLLKDDGVIFISIDDNEVHNLRRICDEIFGEENFVAIIIVEGTPKNDPHIVSTAHEYCLVYVKNFELAKHVGYGLKNPLYDAIEKTFIKYKSQSFEKVESELKKLYANLKIPKKDNIWNYKYADKNGVYRTGPIDDPQSSGAKDLRLNPKTGQFCKTPFRGWSCSVDTWNEWIKNDLILFPDNDEQLPSKKTYIHSDRLDVLRSHYKIQTRKDTDHLKKIFDTDRTVFSNPKPRKLLKQLISICQDQEFYVLDFFAGSGSTSASVMELNTDGKKRKMISVQLPEPLKESNSNSNKEKLIIREGIKYLNMINRPHLITEISKERIRLEAKRIKEELKDQPEALDQLDLGFKVFKLDSSNIHTWETAPDKLEDNLFRDQVIKDDRTAEDVLYEVLLKYGLDLTYPIEEVTLDAKKVYSVGAGQLIFCLEDGVTRDTAQAIINWAKKEEIIDTKVVFKDSGFTNDVEKTNIIQLFKTHGITDVKSI